jgi:hypothetical protein
MLAIEAEGQTDLDDLGPLRLSFFGLAILFLSQRTPEDFPNHAFRQFGAELDL